MCIQRSSKKDYILILRIAFPIIIQGIVFQLQLLVDKSFLGKLDTKYLSAVGAAQFPFNTTLDSLVAICTGVTIVVSQLYGMKKRESIAETVKSAVFYNSILSFFLFILWFCFSKNVLTLMSVNASIMNYSIEFVKICSFYFLFLGIDCSLQAMLQGIGDTKPILVAGLFKVAINIILDWLLIFGHFGFPALNIKGAALATVMANIISTIIIMLYCCLMNRKKVDLLKGKILSKKLAPYKKIIALGLPTGMEFFVWNFSNLFLVSFLNSISYMATTIYTVTFSVEAIAYMIYNGIGRAGLSLEGQKIGEDDIPGAKRIFRITMWMNVVSVSISMIIICTLSRQLVSVFTQEEDVIRQAIPFMIFNAFILIPKSLNIIVGSGIRAYGDTKWMLYSQIIGSIYVIVCSFVLVKIIGLGISAIYITVISDEMIRAIINLFYYYKGNLKNTVVL